MGFEHVAVAAEVADFFDDADIDGGGGGVLRLAVLNERVEESVGAGVVCLAELAVHPGDGAEKEEEVEVGFLGQ